LDIDLLEDIDEGHTESDGFSDLVLPDEHKDIVRALVKTHARGPRSASGENGRPVRQLDLVKGKGKGLIILLHGVPGVGKTSTAECVAAHTNRPLFPITCGDIGGQTPREVETNLESYFDLARKWGCVLLLDEADVFLGERTKGDILQNSLISGQCASGEVLILITRLMHVSLLESFGVLQRYPHSHY
jgi:SpoVK/Ycf46/Vps4 family AAA+-type ATPase